jgi:hypothetical protein
MTSAINEIDMEFEESRNLKIETIGSLSQISGPCPIKYISMKLQHPQVHQDCFICTWYYSNTFRYSVKRYFTFIGFAILVYKYPWIMKTTITK